MYHLTVSSEAEPGEFILEVGVYDANDPAFPRLAVMDDLGEPMDDRVIVTFGDVGG